MFADECSILEYQWKYIGYDPMVELYNCMGKREEKISKRMLSYNNMADCVFLNVNFDDIYEKVERLEYNIEFKFVILMLIKNVNNNFEDLCRICL